MTLEVPKYTRSLTSKKKETEKQKPPHRQFFCKILKKYEPSQACGTAVVCLPTEQANTQEISWSWLLARTGTGVVLAVLRLTFFQVLYHHAVLRVSSCQYFCNCQLFYLSIYKCSAVVISLVMMSGKSGKIGIMVMIFFIGCTFVYCKVVLIASFLYLLLDISIRLSFMFVVDIQCLTLKSPNYMDFLLFTQI